MKELTKIEKEEIAFLIRQEVNNGKKLIEELEKVLKTKVDNQKETELFIQLFEGHQIRKQRFEEIARKLEIEL